MVVEPVEKHAHARTKLQGVAPPSLTQPGVQEAPSSLALRTRLCATVDLPTKPPCCSEAPKGMGANSTLFLVVETIA